MRIVQVDELLRQLADYKNDYADMAAAKLYGCARPVGMLTATCKTVCMMCGCPIASGNRSDSPRGIVNYYLDGQTQAVIGLSIKTLATGPAGSAWGGAGQLHLYPTDTAQLSLGYHSFQIDYLGDNRYAPSQYQTQFLITSG